MRALFILTFVCFGLFSQTYEIKDTLTINGVNKKDYVFKVIKDPLYFKSDSTLRINYDIFNSLKESAKHSNYLRNFTHTFKGVVLPYDFEYMEKRAISIIFNVPENKIIKK